MTATVTVEAHHMSINGGSGRLMLIRNRHNNDRRQDRNKQRRELPASTDFSSLKRFRNSIYKINLARYCNEL